jgi:hypothetical protein
VKSERETGIVVFSLGGQLKDELPLYVMGISCSLEHVLGEKRGEISLM